MGYFLGIEEINKINTSNLDEMKCITRYNSTEENCLNFRHSNSKITVQKNTIVCQKENNVTKYLYLGKLSSATCNQYLPVYKSHETSWRDRIHFDIVDNRETLLYVRDDSKDENMLFVNGMEFLRLNYVFNEITEVQFFNNYLVIVTRNMSDSRNNVEAVQGFILIQIIPKSDNEDERLVEVFQTNLNNILHSPTKVVGKIRFNSSKILLLLRSYSNIFLMTFNIRTLQFSSLLELSNCMNILFNNLFYCSSNILQDLIIFVDTVAGIVYIVKESIENRLYIYKESTILLPEGYTIEDDIKNVYCCNNRNNEIILFIDVLIESRFAGVELADEEFADQEFADQEFPDELYQFRVITFYYDILNDKTCKILDRFSNDAIMSSIFFNRTGEEIFVSNKNQLDIYVYKSQVRSLKRTCQLLVLQQYSSEQLKKLNLPKYLLVNSD